MDWRAVAFSMNTQTPDLCNESHQHACMHRQGSKMKQGKSFVTHLAFRTRSCTMRRETKGVNWAGTSTRPITVTMPCFWHGCVCM